MFSADLITGKTYRLTEDSCTWLEAKSRCSLAGKDIVELDESTGRIKSTANISDSETFTAWIDAYKIQPHVLLNKGKIQSPPPCVKDKGIV